MKTLTLAILFWTSAAGAAVPASGSRDMAVIHGGTYIPFVVNSNSKKQDQPNRTPTPVHSFLMDRKLVTNKEYLDFVQTHPEWRKSSVKPVFADEGYLAHWRSDLEFGPEEGMKPVTHVSWFAARAYCEAHGKSLPTNDEWEYVLFDKGREQPKVKERILAWYATPSSSALLPVTSGGKNGLGVFDLSVLVWEWTEDFNGFLASEEQRESGGVDKNMFCGGGALGTADRSDYAAYMRYSLRASLKASYTTANLGFRCAKEMP